MASSVSGVDMQSETCQTEAHFFSCRFKITEIPLLGEATLQCSLYDFSQCIITGVSVKLVANV